MKTNAYNKLFVDDAMIRLGDMLEYACLDLGYDPDSFFWMFIKSGIAKRFQIGDPSIVLGRSGPELVYMVLELVDNKTSFKEPTWRSDRSDVFWCGWVLAYYQWYENLTFKEIWNSISIRTLLKMYNTLHEADILKTVEELNKLRIEPLKLPIKTLRIMRGLTQSQLENVLTWAFHKFNA